MHVANSFRNSVESLCKLRILRGVNRQTAFLLGFMLGVFTDQLVQVLIDLLFTHTL
jgi:hypothetical protein